MTDIHLHKNLYVDLDGTIKPHKFPREGLWYFDGQFWYLPPKTRSN